MDSYERLLQRLGKNLKSGTLELNLRRVADRESFIRSVRSDLKLLGYESRVLTDEEERNLAHVNYWRSQHA